MTEDHSAAASAVGYSHQTAWALLELLRQAPERPDQQITLEMHDDVAWERDGVPLELTQVKHHGKAGGLGDRSDDLWRTLKVWMDSAYCNDSEGPLMGLVTTNYAKTGTVAFFLSSDETKRNTAKAVKLLDEAALDSKNSTTAKARAQWTARTASNNLRLADRIRVFDSSPAAQDVDEAVGRALLWATPSEHKDTFLGLVTRWWNRVSLDILTKRRTAIATLDAQREISIIRDSFSTDSLPTLVEPLSSEEEQDVFTSHDDRAFVHQVRWVGGTPTALRKATADYFRAISQGTLWLDTHLIGMSELQVYERNIRDEWERAFDEMEQDLPEDADENQKRAAGLNLFRRLQSSLSVSIRRNYTEVFYARGKRHELAERHMLGWHPDFESKLRQLTVDSE